MTEKRDLKKLVRERQARTGESYVTALMQIRAQRPVMDEPEEDPKEPAIDVIELVDLTEVGATLGYKCRIWCTPTLAERIDPAATLSKYRDLLLTTKRDAGLDLMRDVALWGLRPPGPHRRPWSSDINEFIVRARAGLGGVSESGRLVALNVEGKAGTLMVLFTLTLALHHTGVQRLRDPALGLAEVPSTEDSPFDWRVLPW